jgi:hypothetical protein
MAVWETYLLHIWQRFIILFLGGAGDPTLCVMHARQALYYWATSPALLNIILSLTYKRKNLALKINPTKTDCAVDLSPSGLERGWLMGTGCGWTGGINTNVLWHSRVAVVDND